MKRLFAAFVLTVAASIVVAGSEPQSTERVSEDPRTTPAYAALVLRKAAVAAELADLSSRLTNDSQDVRARRFEMSILGREMETMRRVGRDGVVRLSDAYGQLVLSKLALEVELYGLRSSYTDGHPEVKKKRVELNVLARELEEILK